MTRASRRRRSRCKPSPPPRMIGANDDAPGVANDNAERVMVGGVLLTAEQTRRFRGAEALQALSDPGAVASGRRSMLALEAEIAAAVNRQRIELDRLETRALEEARGEAVEVSDRQEHRGRLRIATRDGLECLLTIGGITSTEHAAGLRYRTDYEMIDPEKGLSPPPMDQTRRITRGGEGWASKRMAREAFVRDLERQIQSEDRGFKGAGGHTPIDRLGPAVWTLREVAGKGSNIRALSSSGSVRARLSRGLALALGCAAIAYGLE